LLQVSLCYGLRQQQQQYLDQSQMSLHEVWQAASASPFAPVISKDNHFLVGFSLLLFGKKAERESPIPG
jgi:hypothetical protein